MEVHWLAEEVRINDAVEDDAAQALGIHVCQVELRTNVPKLDILAGNCFTNPVV